MFLYDEAKFKLSRSILLLFLLPLLIFVAGCSGDTNGSDMMNDTRNAGDISDQQIAEDLFARTLTISLLSFQPEMQDTIDKFADLHPGVEVMVHGYDNDYYKYRQHMSAQLLAGTADDIMNADGLLDIRMFDSDYFADFYPLMHNDPSFREEDYFAKVFKGMEYKNKLMVFPIGFSFYMIGVNSLFSDNFTRSYLQFDTISDRQLLDLYKSLPDTSRLTLLENFDVYLVVARNITTYIDFENKTCDFINDDFKQLITDVKDATDPQKMQRGGLGYRGRLRESRLEQKEHAAKYMLVEVGTYLYAYPMLFPYVEEVFTHFIPITNEQGDILIRPLDNYLISQASENKELAWEFLKFLSSPQGNESNNALTFIPTNRATMRTIQYSNTLPFVERARMMDPIRGEDTKIVDQLMTVLEKYSDMTSKGITFTGNEILMSIIKDVLTDFHTGILTVDQTAAELQNKVSLFLIE
jgi:ABC-type glycerol-3-phosphate transport system substrate-binding protein